jgi:hypothetical protein
MNKMQTICDLCEMDATHGPQALEIRAAYTEVHVCSGCLKRPIWDLAEKVRGLQVAHEKAMMAGACQPCEAPYPPTPDAMTGIGRLSR